MYNTRKYPLFSSQLLNAKHEVFKPQFEWIEGQANHMLVIQLPGFKREEIRVQHNKAGRLLVRGSRLAEDNKFIYVDQPFDLPKDVKADVISGKFEDGCLTLVMPKTVITEDVTKEKILSKEATNEEKPKQEVTKEVGPKQKEEKHEQGKTAKEKKDENIREEKTTSNEAMQNEATQTEKSTLTEAMASSVKDAKYWKADARHNEPTQDNGKVPSAGTDITQNELHSKPKAEEKQKNKFDNIINKHEDVENVKAKTDEGTDQEEKKIEKAIKEAKESYNQKVMEVSSEVKSKMGKTKEKMQKMKSKIKEIYKDTPEMMRKKINKIRHGEDGWLNRKYIDGAVEKINRNRNTIAVAVLGLTVGLYISRKLKARSG